MNARAERLRAEVAAERSLPPSERLANMLHATHTTADAKALLDAYRAEVLAEAAAAADFHSDFFMAAELRRMAVEAGESRG